MIHVAPLAGIVAGLQRSQATPAQVLDQSLARVRTCEPVLRALVDEPDRLQRLGGELRRIDGAAPRGDLWGAPVGVKDIFHVDGLPTTAGSRLPVHVLAGPEAGCVTRLKRAGAIVLAKTVTAEFAGFVPGATRNPHNPDHTPGGSSSGSAAAVAAGYCPLALGTQTVGSVIRPAAYCGVVGFKPTFGRIATDGVIAYAPSVDTIGLFTQDVEGARIAAAALLDDWTRGQTTDGPRLLVPDGPYLASAEPEAREAFECQIDRLRSFGVPVERALALEDIAEVSTRHRRLATGELARVHARWARDYSHLYSPGTLAAIDAGRAVSDDELAEGRAGMAKLRDALHAVLDAHRADLFVCPAATGPAPAGIASTGDPAMNLPWTHAGLPALTLPAGTSRDRLPFGLQCVGRFGDDERCLAWCASIETALARN